MSADGHQARTEYAHYAVQDRTALPREGQGYPTAGQAARDTVWHLDALRAIKPVLELDHQRHVAFDLQARAHHGVECGGFAAQD